MSDSLRRFANSSLRTVESGATVAELRRLSGTFNIHHFPVVEDGMLVGVICECDVQQVSDEESRQLDAQAGYTQSRTRRS